jgi:hypothetical protein
LFISILAGEVKSLCREIPDNISEVTSPEGTESLFFHDTRETISNTVVLLISSHIRVGILYLEEELNSLNRGNSGL